MRKPSESPTRRPRTILGAELPYAACPKCRHAPLPEDQALPAACPACGLILAKYGAAPPARRSIDEADEDTWLERTHALLFQIPESVPKWAWQGRLVTLAVFALWTLWIWIDMDVRHGNAGSGFLHLVLLPFHEAGHYALFRWFGQFIMTLGGTLGQHLMPIVLAVALLTRRHDPFGAALFTWLLGFSLVDMAVYMYDAHDPKLVLLGGRTGAESDFHDWINTFGDLGLLGRARGIGVFFAAAGVTLMLAALAWAAQVLRMQRRAVIA